MKQIRRFKELLESSPYNCSIAAVILLFSLTNETIVLEIKRGANKRRLGRRRLPAENDPPPQSDTPTITSPISSRSERCVTEGWRFPRRDL